MKIKLRPDMLSYINRRNAYRDSEQLDRAIADYAEVIKLAPQQLDRRAIARAELPI